MRVGGRELRPYLPSFVYSRKLIKLVKIFTYTKYEWLGVRTAVESRAMERQGERDHGRYGGYGGGGGGELSVPVIQVAR